MAYLNSTPTDYRWKEVGPIEATFEVVSGTGTIEGVASGATFTLLDANGNIAGGLDRVPVLRAEIADDKQSGTIIYDLDSSLVTPNIFYGNFDYRPVVSDLILRLQNADIQIRVLPRVETIATFDPLTARGRLRKELRDVSDFEVPGTGVGITNAVFSDNEVDGFLSQASPLLPVGASYTSLNNQILYQAAYYGWTRVAADKATLVKVKKILFIQSSTMSTYQAAMQMAQSYLEMAGSESLPVFGNSTNSPTKQQGCRDGYDEFGHRRSGYQNPLW